MSVATLARIGVCHGALLLLGAFMASGCEMVEISRTSGWSRWQQKTGQTGTLGNQDRKKANREDFRGALAKFASQQGYAIELRTFDGEQRLKMARQLKQSLERTTGMPDVWYRDHEGAAIVYRGRYLNPESQAAQRDLQLTKLAVVEGWRPFKDAKIVSLGQGDLALSDRDLRGYPGMYTLQIGFYTDAAGSDYRRKAEQWVDKLRKDGEEAYFYHGPNMTNVTVGIYSQEDAYERDGAIFRHSAIIRALKGKFPHNLGNGERVPVRAAPGKEAFQESRLVVVPQ